MGVEIESDRQLDLARISLATGFDLIPADNLEPDELASVGVHTFECISFARYGNKSGP